MVVYNCGAFPDQDETVFYNNELQVSGKVVKPKWDVTVNKSECEQDAKIDGDGSVALLTPLHKKDDEKQDQGLAACLESGLSALSGDGLVGDVMNTCHSAHSSVMADSQCALSAPSRPSPDAGSARRAASLWRASQPSASRRSSGSTFRA